MPKRRLTIWATVRLVLSPSVEAMKTSARWTPASISASTSSAVPTVKMPPASSQVWPSDLDEPFVRKRILVEHRHLVTLGKGSLGDSGPHAPRSDDQHEHRAGCYWSALAADAGLAAAPAP